MDAQLFEDPMDVVLDGRKLDSKPGGDFLVREPLLDKLGNLELTRRQHRASVEALRPAR